MGLVNEKLDEVLQKLRAISVQDEEILGAFLKPEHDINPTFAKYEDWEILVGSEELFERPATYVLGFVDKYMKYVPMAEKFLNKVPELLNEASVLEEMVVSLAELQLTEFLSIVQNTRLLISERTPAQATDLLLDQSAREQIYRMVFPSRQAFEDFNKKFNDTYEKMVLSVGKVAAGLRDGSIKIPLTYKMLLFPFKKQLNKFPKEDVVKAYFAEQNKFSEQRAAQIYEPAKK